MTAPVHPRHQLDPVVHFPIRLSMMACLAGVHEAEFGFVAETVEINAPTCSKQVAVLEEAGYISVRKGRVGRQPRTWLALTPAGRAALQRYLDTMQAIAAAAASGLLPGVGARGPGAASSTGGPAEGGPAEGGPDDVVP